MIRTRAARPCPLWFSFALMPLLLVAIAHIAPAQPAPSAPQPPTPSTALPNVPNEIKNSFDVTATKPQIEKFVQMATAQLASGTPEEQAKARDALRSDALVNGQPKASAAYLNVYAQLLNQQLLTLAQNPDPRVRLNAAIVTAAVAQPADNAQLAPTALALINDKSEPVVLWGIKAARWIIPAQLAAFAGQKDTTLPDAIIAAVGAHPSGLLGGPIAYEAYEALTLDITPQRPKATPPMQAIVAPHVQKLMELRIKMYINGVPPSPRAESFGSGFLSRPAIWPTLPAPTQVAVMQDFCNVVDLMAQQAATANSLDRGELAATIAKIASAISVLADPAGTGPALLIQPATALTQRSLPPAITPAVSAILPAVLTVPQFKGLVPPPRISGHEAAPPPASAPTTGPVVIPGAIAVPPPSATPPAPTTPTTRPRTGAATPGATTPGASSGPRPTTPANPTGTSNKPPQYK